LALLYAVLYALLQSEDHALVAGSVLVFGLIALVMLLTRKVDWYALGERR
jgi:inner membrane protein